MDTLFVGRNILELDIVDSTNSYAIDMIKQVNIAEGSIIFTYNQTKGRGQMGNVWQSESGKNLTFSLVLHPHFLSIDKQFYLSKITSLAVLEMLTHFLNTSLYDIKIKWPNDILVNEEKIAGILIENILRGNFLQSSVIGVGVNINQRGFQELAKKATSLAVLLEKELVIKEALSLFCSHFEAYYLMLKQAHFEKITQLYLGSLYRFNERAKFTAKEESFQAILTHVEESGLLVLTKDTHEVLKFNFKEVGYSV